MVGTKADPVPHGYAPAKEIAQRMHWGRNKTYNVLSRAVAQGVTQKIKLRARRGGIIRSVWFYGPK